MTETVVAKRKKWARKGIGEDGLNTKQTTFVQNYVANGGNGSAAYKAAGYGTGRPDVGASALLDKPSITRAIQAALKERGYSPDAIRSKLMVFASNRPSEFVPFLDGSKTLKELELEGVDSSVVQEILVTVKPSAHGDQTTRKLRFYDAQLAVTTLGRMLGLLDERKSISVTGMVAVAALDLRDKTPEELASIQAALASGKPPPGFEQQVSADPKAQTTTLIDEEIQDA